MHTKIDPAKRRRSLHAADRLPRHDLWFGSPQAGPEAGLPIGDGVTGALLWLEEDAIRIQLNRSDLWEDAPERGEGGAHQPPPYGCIQNVPDGSTEDDGCFNSSVEEELTCQKHAGEITIRFSSPLLNRTYQKQFCARLSLKDAEATIESSTPFSRLGVSAIACAREEITAIRLRLSSKDRDAPEITLARWGTRTLWRWYCQQRFLPEKGLEGTEACAEDGRIFVSQTLNTLQFCLGLSVLGARTETAVKNRHAASVRAENTEELDCTIFAAVRTGETAEAAREACLTALRKAEQTGYDELRSGHIAEWSAFWNTSYVSFPDDYLENLWYLWLYLMNSSSRGTYPPHFTIGLWSFSRDYVPWVYYFHYNLQHLYAPLDAAGHGKLANCYFDLRKNGIPACRAFAERVKGRSGIFLHDVTDRYGRGANYDALNCSCAAQAAMQMFRHWRYTGDETFLLEYALPMMRGAAEYYLDLLAEGEDGRLHISGTTAYEGNPPTDDTITDLVMIRALFPALAPFEDEETRDRLKDAVSRLPDPILLPLSEKDDGAGERFRFGVGKGKTPHGDGQVFGIGKLDGVPVRKSYGDPASEKHYYGFPDIELCPLYPAGIFGLKDRGTPLFKVMQNQIAIHPRGDECGHWNMLPIYLARMGMASELIENGRGMASSNQGFPNGFNAETSEPGHPRDPGPEWYRVRDVDTGEITRQRSQEFIHFDFETVPILAQAVTDALLQSHEGFLRVFPAVRREDEAVFSLYAEGGFSVCGENNRDGWIVTVESLRGERCLLCLPAWAGEVYAYRIGETGPVPAECPAVNAGQDTALEMSLRAGETMLLAGCPAEELRFVPEEASAPNNTMKECGNARLGMPPLHGGY